MKRDGGVRNRILDRSGKQMIGILSDAHGNFPAFKLAIDILGRHGADRFIFLGDAIGYVPTPLVLSAIRALDWKIKCIQGNHEDIMLRGDFDSVREPIYQHRTVLQQMDVSQIETIQAWPLQLTADYAVGPVRFVHGSPNEPTYDYIYPDSDLSVFDVKERYVFMGHTHRPFIKKHRETTFINVGSCGLPRDHGSFGAAALFDELTGSVKIIRFDISRETQTALSAVGQVHPTVIDVYNRKIEGIIGEFVGN